MNMFKAVYKWLYSANSMKKIIASYISLRIQIENSLERFMCYNDRDIIRNRICGSKGPIVSKLILFVESIFVDFVYEGLVIKDRCIEGDINLKMRFVLQIERMRPFVQISHFYFASERLYYSLDD